MAISITHPFVNPKADGADTTIARPSDWNAAHSLAGLGTGVETALGVNVGTAGAVIVNGGALGTPSSGNLANCTGYPTSAPSYPVTVAGTITSGGIPYFSSTTVESSSALLAANNMVVGGGAGAAPATTSLVQATPGGTSVTVGDELILNKATAFTNSLFMDMQNNGTSYIQISTLGYFWGQPGDINNAAFASKNSHGTGVHFPDNSTTALIAGGVIGIAVTSAKAAFGGVSGGATTRVEINKSVTGIADGVAKATFTVTIPNAAHSAGGKFILKGAAGAGGAVGADEFSAYIEYDWVVTRTANLNAVATLSAGLLTAISASVAGGATVTISGALSAISGANNATNTFTLNVTITAGSGSATNHTCFCYGSVLNDNASGVTIA